MADLAKIIADKLDDGSITSFVNDARAGFALTMPDGSTVDYVGARYLPLVNRENAFDEDGIYFRSVIAYDATRYAPVVPRGGMESEPISVRLRTNDTGAQITGRDYDVIVQLARLNRIDGVERILQDFLLTQIIKPLNDLIEKQRWAAIADGIVKRRGDSGYQEDVQYANPAGHRVTVPSGTTAAPAGWNDPNYSILNDIFAMADKLGVVTDMITSRRILSLMSMNNEIKAYGGMAVTNAQGQAQTLPGRVLSDSIDNILRSNGLPGITLHEATYEQLNGTRVRYLRDTAFVMLNSSSIDPTVVSDRPELIAPTTLGFVGNGIATAQTTNGKAVYLRVNGNRKSPNVEAEGTQVSLPVTRNAEGRQRLGVLNIPAKAV